MWPFNSKRSAPKPVVTSQATILTIPGHKITVTLVEAKYFTAKDLIKVKKALAVLAYVVNHPEFTRRVMAMKFTSTTDTSYQVIDKIFKANELNSGDDYEIDYSLEYYTSRWSRVVGYTLPNSFWIWMNWKYHLNFKSYETAGNLKHEQCHKLGYGHSSSSDFKSVPYSIGYLVEELGQRFELEAMQLLEQVEVSVG